MARTYPTKSALTFITGVALALTALSLSAMTAPVMASVSDSAPLRQGLPGRRISGGSRSPDTACLITPDQPVIALVPKSNISKTLSERPTFWVFVPAVNRDRILEFGLFDAEGTLIYQKDIASSGRSELVALSLPETVAPLRVDQNYRWYFSVVCNPHSRAEDLAVTSWVRRVNVDSALSEQLARSTPQEQIALYQVSELWYDAFTEMVALGLDETIQSSQQSQPWIARQWSDLIAAIELTNLIPSSFANLTAENPTDAS